MVASLRAAGLSEALADAFYAELAGDALSFLFDRPPHVEIDGALEGALHSRAGPCVIAASHTAHWEATARAMQRRLPLGVIVKRQSQPWAERLVGARRGALVTTYGPGSVWTALGWLRGGISVVALHDQAPSRRAGAVDDRFLGQPCWSDPTAAWLSARSGAPLWVVAQERQSRTRLRVHLLDCIEAGPLERSWVAEATRRATARLEAFVREYPTSWLWLHRRWKDLPA